MPIRLSPLAGHKHGGSNAGPLVWRQEAAADGAGAAGDGSGEVPACERSGSQNKGQLSHTVPKPHEAVRQEHTTNPMSSVAQRLSDLRHPRLAS